MPAYDLTKSEDTYAERTTRRLRFYRIVTLLLFLIMVGSACWFFTKASVSSQRILREAKDIRKALQLLSIEQYSSGSAVFDPKKADGMAEGVKERLSQLAEYDGELRLTGWDVAENEPLAFTYNKGNYVVFFSKEASEEQQKQQKTDGEEGLSEDGSRWEVYLRVRVKSFE